MSDYISHKFKYLFRLLQWNPKPLILMYHRIATPDFDPWALCVSPANFRMQMRWLNAHRTPLAMREFVERLGDETLPDNAVAVTFDDGYSDNFSLANPILEEIGIPATFFLATAHLGRQDGFWWDELAGLILARKESIDTKFSIADAVFEVSFDTSETWSQSERAWRGWQEPATARQKAYIKVWSALKMLEHNQQTAAMDTIRAKFEKSSPIHTDMAMQAANIGELAGSSFISIGAHTRHHPSLTSLPPQAQKMEISISKSDCESLVGQPIPGFAYPYGDFDLETARLVRESGFDWACSTRRDFVDPSNLDLFDLPRLQVMDYSIARFRLALKIAR